jgi:hypothetical protein
VSRDERDRRNGAVGRHHVRRRGGNNPWYATSIGFLDRLETALANEPEHRGQVIRTLTRPPPGRAAGRVLTYHHVGLDVPGRVDPVPVTVEFHELPIYDTYGLAAADYPRVLADPGATSPHRLPGDALCLWYPADPTDRRWDYTHGLVALLNLARNHLFFEDYWRETGVAGGPGRNAGTWLGDEAPHGFPAEWRAAS